jgi:hypothetical protein
MLARAGEAIDTWNSVHLRMPVGEEKVQGNPPPSPAIDASSHSLYRARTVTKAWGSCMGTTSRLQVPLRPSQALYVDVSPKEA